MNEIGLNIKFNRNLMLRDTCPPLCKFKLYESLLLVYNRAIIWSIEDSTWGCATFRYLKEK